MQRSSDPTRSGSITPRATQGKPFLSTHFTEAAGTLTEMLLALSVLDLPFKAEEHEIESAEGKLTLRAASPLLLVRRDIHAAAPLHEVEPPLLLSQNLLRLDDRWRTEDDGQQREAYVTGELTVDVPLRVPSRGHESHVGARRLDLLLQIPEGSMPLSGGSRTKSIEVQLGPYSTKELEYSFYFPSPGTSVTTRCTLERRRVRRSRAADHVDGRSPSLP
jgi:hypothetical protein